MGMVDVAALFRDHLVFDPADPAWPDGKPIRAAPIGRAGMPTCHPVTDSSAWPASAPPVPEEEFDVQFGLSASEIATATREALARTPHPSDVK
jgi:hypothetical protein